MTTTVVTISNTVLNTNRTTTPFPAVYTPIQTNAAGTQVSTITYTRFRQVLTTLVTVFLHRTTVIESMAVLLQHLISEQGISNHFLQLVRQLRVRECREFLNNPDKPHKHSHSKYRHRTAPLKPQTRNDREGPRLLRQLHRHREQLFRTRLQHQSRRSRLV
jgi:flagellar biosynthesis regulator FlbT